MERFYSKLMVMREELPPVLQAKFNHEEAMDMAASLLDEAIFDIVQELEEIQQLSERSLLTRRMKVVNDHKRQRVDLSQRHKQELKDCQQHNLSLVKARQERETGELEKRLATDMQSTDQKIILELDQMVLEQQATLQKAAVPFFMVSNDAQDTQLQCYLLQFIQRLASNK